MSRDMAKAVYILMENEFSNESGQTPLHIFNPNKAATAEALTQFRSSRTVFCEQDRNGNTALHLACQPALVRAGRRGVRARRQQADRAGHALL